MPNGMIRNYQITYFPTEDTIAMTTVHTGSSALEFDITGLTAFTEYSVSILAVTVTTGESSAAIVIRTNEDSKFYKLLGSSI